MADDSDQEYQLREVCAELGRRLRAGEDCRAEDLLAPFPTLSADEEAVLEVAFAEFCLREELGQHPEPEAWYQRFSSIKERLHRLFLLHHALPATSLSDMPAVPSTLHADALRSPVVGQPVQDGYEILGELGRGGMGIVYKARQRNLNRIVAIKMLLPGRDGRGDRQTRFRAEAEAIARLQHPHIVQIYEIGERGGCPYLTLEYLGGGTLSQHLNGKPLPPREAAALVELLARAMNQVHQLGIIHRDLKPSNILRTADGIPKIADFGLAKDLEATSDTSAPGAIIGTASYMAPEQAGGGRVPVGPAADIYSLGAILYEGLTGRPPFLGSTTLETLHLVRNVDPVPPSRLQPRMPHDLENICLKCLDKSIALRYENAQALADDLQRYQRGEPVRARPLGPGRRLVKWVRRQPWTAAAYFLALVVLTVGSLGTGAAWLWRNAEDARENLAAALLVIEEKHHETEQARRRLDRHSAFHRVGLAFQAWQEGEIEQARLRLADCPPEHRSWDWGHVDRLCNGDFPALEGPQTECRAVAFSPDGVQLAAASSDHRVYLWKWRTAEKVWTLTGHTDRVLSVCFLPKGRLLATGSADGTARLWDLDKGKEIAVLKGHTKAVLEVAVDPGGTLLASASEDGTVCLWDVDTRTLARTYRGHTHWVTSVCFHPTGLRIVSGSGDGTAHLWDPKTGETIFVIHEHIQPLACVRFHPDGQSLATGAWNGGIALLGSPNWRCFRQLSTHSNRKNAIAYSPDGQRLAAASDDSTLTLWNLDGPNEPWIFKGHVGPVYGVAFSPNGEFVASASGSRGRPGEVRVWPARPTQEASLLKEHTNEVKSVAYSPDGTWVASSSWDKSVVIRDGHTGRFRGTVLWPISGLNRIAWSPDGTRLAAGAMNGVIPLWDSQTLQRASILAGHVGPVWSVAFSPEGTRLASAGQDRTVRVWDVRSAEQLLTLDGHTGPVSDLAFTPDGSRLVSASQDGTLRIWDARSGDLHRILTGHNAAVHAVRISPDGMLVASASRDRTVRLWSLQSEEAPQILHGHADEVMCVAFHPAGARLATGSRDRTIRIWDLREGLLILTLRRHRDFVLGVDFSPDGSGLASGSRDQTVRLWQGRTAEFGAERER